MKPDWTLEPPFITARIKFLSTEEGGLSTPLGSEGRAGFPMFLPGLPEGHALDAFLNLSVTGAINPGQTIVTRLKFLSPELALPLVSVGTGFKLWAGKLVATGEVIEVNK